MSQVSLNITVPVFNRPRLTLQALESARGNTSVEHTLTVVDNGSEKETRDLLINLKQRGIIDHLIRLEKNYGVAVAANVGWRLVPAALYMKLDNDIVIHDRHWFPIIWNYMKKAPRTAVWGADFHNQLDNPRLVKERQGLTGKTRGHVSGGAVLIPRDISDYIGYWCEDYGLYGCEDGDYGMRLTSEDIDQYYYDHHPFMKHMGDDWQDMKNRHGLNKTDERSKSYPLWLTNRWLLTHDYRSVNFPAAYVPADFDGYVLRLEPNRHYINIFKAWTRFHELCMLADRMQEDWRNTPPLVGEMLNALNALISVQNRDWNAAVLEAENAYHAVRRRLGSSHPL